MSIRSYYVKSIARAAASIALLAGGVGCGGGGDSGPDFGTNDPELIVAMGNSITFGLGDVTVPSCSESYRTAGGYCPRLAGLAGKTVVNTGVCGALSADGASSIQRVLHRYGPGVVLIEYGVNDLFNGSEEVLRNVRVMVGAAISNQTVPVIGTLTPTTGEHRGWEPFIQNVNRKLLALCDELKVECADLHQAFLDDPGFAISPYALLSDDGLHPNAAGYEVMSRAWNEALDRVY